MFHQSTEEPRILYAIHYNDSAYSKPQLIELKKSSAKQQLFSCHSDVMPTCLWISNIQCLVRDYGLWMCCPRGTGGTWPANSHQETKERETKTGPRVTGQAPTHVLPSTCWKVTECDLHSVVWWPGIGWRPPHLNSQRQREQTFSFEENILCTLILVSLALDKTFLSIYNYCRTKEA